MKPPLLTHLTVTVTDGTNTDTETINISINDLTINTLATTLANSGAALAESSSSGTAVASSSINNPDSETITYTLSGTGSSNFSVDSSGNVTTNATLDFETAKSYALTLTATAGSTSVTDTFTVNVGNVEELNSAVLRYSAAYNSASRTGFSATATRGPSGSSLPAYYLEQVGTTATSVITDVDNVSNNSVPVEIAGGSALNWRYFFPIDTAGAGQYAFAPNSASVDAKYKSLLGTNVTTTISNSEVITAGRFSGGNFWFMATDKAATDISYTSSVGGSFASSDKALIIWNWNSNLQYDGSVQGSFQDLFDDRNITYDVVKHTGSFPTNLDDYRVIVDMRNFVGSDSSSGTHGAAIATWLQTSDRVFIGISNDPCCTNNQQYFANYYTQILNNIGDSSVTSSNIFIQLQMSIIVLPAMQLTHYGFTSPNYNNNYKHNTSQNLILDTSMGVSLTTTSDDGYSSALLYLRDDTNSQTLSDVVLFADVNVSLLFVWLVEMQ